MKRDAIKSEAETHLAKLGFGRGSYVWQPLTAELLIIINGEVRTFKLKSGMSRRAFTYEMGRIAGLAEAAGVKPSAHKTNGPQRSTPPAEQLKIPATVPV